MKQEVNANNTEEYEIMEEKKPVKDVKEQSTNDQQIQKVTTKQNYTNNTTTAKEKATRRSQISERRLSAVKQGQLKNNKYEDQKV